MLIVQYIWLWRVVTDASAGEVCIILFSCRRPSLALVVDSLTGKSTYAIDGLGSSVIYMSAEDIMPAGSELGTQ